MTNYKVIPNGLIFSKIPPAIIYGTAGEVVNDLNQVTQWIDLEEASSFQEMQRGAYVTMNADVIPPHPYVPPTREQIEEIVGQLGVRLEPAPERRVRFVTNGEGARQFQEALRDETNRLMVELPRVDRPTRLTESDYITQLDLLSNTNDNV